MVSPKLWQGSHLCRSEGMTTVANEAVRKAEGGGERQDRQTDEDL